MPAPIPIEALEVSAYRIPTDAPESDGTFAWDATVLVLVRASGGGRTGLGYTYADAATARLIREHLAPRVKGRDALSVAGPWERMVRSVRNLGETGIAAMAVSAVDNALWDLKARILGVTLADLLGKVRDSVPAYGSGGFTAYDRGQLQDQLGGWARQGFGMVKMKIGREPDHDMERAGWAREAIGPAVALFVDANGAYARKRALAMAEGLAGLGVTWFEEPVPAGDREGTRFIRGRLPAGMELSGGEYGYRLDDFRLLLESGAVDVLQADVTRCLGITGFLKVSALSEAHSTPLSSHCAPAQTLPVACASRPLRHVEWFHDHARIEAMLFDGAPRPEGGRLRPAGEGAGNGLAFKDADADKYKLDF